MTEIVSPAMPFTPSMEKEPSSFVSVVKRIADRLSPRPRTYICRLAPPAVTVACMAGEAVISSDWGRREYAL